MILEKKILSLNEQLIRKESKNFILSEMKRIGIDKLPYSYSSLSRFIDSETMNFHYNKHYKGYVKKLNKALSEKDYGDVELEEIVKKISRYNKTIRNNAGGAFNHALFWKMLSPKKQQLKGGLLEKINKDFGSFVKFKQKFENLSKKVFGSGWIWLTLSKNNNLKIVTTPNQDNPLMDIVKNGGFPILGLDLWEHAYYLKYRNLRDDYISNFWDFVNWEFVTSLYEKKVKKKPINENMTEKFDRNPFECTKEKEYEYRFVFNVNPKLKKRFQNKLDDIFKELFPENWYEHNEYRKGDIRGLYDFRGQPGRSILNLITTNYSCYCR
jgi:Fe-Mn family superoxide dismutase